MKYIIEIYFGSILFLASIGLWSWGQHDQTHAALTTPTYTLSANQQ